MISLTALLLTLCACADNKIQNEPAETLDPQPDSDIASEVPDAVSGEVVISFDYERQSGYASNQYAVWIEDPNGAFIKTLCATRWTANGGYQSRPDSIAMWVEKSKLASMTKSEVDAISSATPMSGAQSYTWDLTDTTGKTVQAGEYKFFVEGTLRWKNCVVYTGVINIGAAPATARADAEFFYVGSDKSPALTSNSPENSMIRDVTADLIL